MHNAARDLDPAKLLLVRRSAIDDLARELEAQGPLLSDESIEALLRASLDHEPLHCLAQLHGGPDRLVRQSIEVFRRFVASPASNAATPAGMVRILLLQNLDLLWWDDASDLETAVQIAQDTSLVDLREERKAGRIHFGFGVAPRSLFGRGRDFLRQRLFPRRQPKGPGLSFTRVRPAMIGVLNELAREAARRTPEGTPPIWVTSITRSVEYQDHLRSLGFSALNPSAHCRGWAADIEVSWFDQFGAGDILKTLLLDYLEQGILNVIDEGRAWHICLNPSSVARYEHASN